MGLRIFVDSDGGRWTAWTVRDDAAGATHSWLAFQNEGGTERRRLLDPPATWEALPERRLDELRQQAEPVPRYLDKHSLPDGMRTVTRRGM